MGLISTEVEIGLGGANAKRYENMGYEIPRVKTQNGLSIPIGAKIIVKVEDLSYGSNAVVNVQCDCCNKIYQTIYRTYFHSNHQGKYYCNSCASKKFLSGENNYQWRFDKTEEERQIARNYPEYTVFIKSVLARDNYTCQCCGIHNNSMEVHHLDGYDWCVEKRTDVKNGTTLCNNCHKNFHSIYGKGNNTRKQYEEWVGNTIPLLENYNGNLPTTRKIYDIDEKRYMKELMNTQNYINVMLLLFIDVAIIMLKNISI